MTARAASVRAQGAKQLHLRRSGRAHIRRLFVEWRQAHEGARGSAGTAPRGRAAVVTLDVGAADRVNGHEGRGAADR